MMLMDWSDLEPGDKIKVRDEHKDLTRAWCYGHKAGVLTITKIEIFGTKIKLWYSANGGRAVNIIIDNKGIYYGTTTPLFEIIELVK